MTLGYIALLFEVFLRCFNRDHYHIFEMKIRELLKLQEKSSKSWHARMHIAIITAKPYLRVVSSIILRLLRDLGIGCIAIGSETSS